MQKTLVVNGVVSKPFDFEALCLADEAAAEARTHEGDFNVFRFLRCYAPVVSYMFEGTTVTDAKLADEPPESLIALYNKVNAWRSEALDALKNA